MHSSKIHLNFALETETVRYDMIRKRGTFEVHKDSADIDEFLDFVNTMSEGEYNFLIYDNRKNRSLPQLKYLFGVILKTISDSLPNHPTVDALYRYYEEVYAPIHVCEIDGEQFEYCDLKNESSSEVSDFITMVANHATRKWGIKFPERDFMKLPEAQELYIEANYDLWKSISQKSSSSQHESR